MASGEKRRKPALGNFWGTVTESWFWKYFFSHLGWVDWFLILFVFVGVLLGLKHGATREFPLISLYVTFEYYSFFAEWLARETPWPESYVRAFTFALIGFLSWFSLRLLFEIGGKLAHLQVFAPFEAILGALVGGVRYFLFFSLISYWLVLLPLDWIHRSYQVQSWSGQKLVQLPANLHAWVKGLIVRKLTA
jgi:uncharacterized membrane protein required for colicin V production